jgi:NitT/TauT family transport system ATP-binding protein
MSGNGRSAAPAIEIRNVSRIYRTSDKRPLLAVQAVDLEIPAGQFVSILGPSGCGKSTLLMMIAGLLSATSGSLSIDGRTVGGPYTAAGIVFQRDVLLEWRTVLDNLLLQPEMRGLPVGNYRARAHELLEMVGLNGFERRYPAELSGGMRQRVAICRALMLQPSLLLMDEPFGALDALTRDQMQIELQHYLGSGTTVVFITHNLEEAIFLSDQVVVMTPRPGTIQARFEIELPRPRRVMMKDEALFDEYSRRIRGLFLEQGVLRERT